MTPSTQARWRAGAAIAALALAGCATLNVKSFSERGVDLSRYRTFDIGPVDSLSTGDPRLDNNMVFRDHLQGAIEKQLMARGFERVSNGSPDILVHYHASVTQQVDVTAADRRFVNRPGYEDKAAPSVFDAGTLTVDVVDARTNQLVWRGWAEHSFDRALDDQAWLDRRIDAAVGRILQLLPRPL